MIELIISDAFSIAELLSPVIVAHNGSLDPLYLFGGINIFSGLVNNNSLTVFGISNNLLGKTNKCLNEICALLKCPDSVLIHLDLSENKFDKEACI